MSVVQFYHQCPAEGGERGKLMREYLKEHPAAFDPDTIGILSAALDEAWRQVEANRTVYKLDGHAEGARNVLAKSIVDMVKEVERDPQRLIQGALTRLRR
jgi:hypothetical protein